MAPAENISQKVFTTYLLQAVLAAALTALGIFLGSVVLRDALVNQRITTESNALWAQVEAAKGEPETLRPLVGKAYFVPAGRMPDAVPAQYRAMPVGLHRIEGELGLLQVTEHSEGKLYMMMGWSTTDRIVRWSSILAVIIATLSILLISWLAYRRTLRFLEPVTHLTREVIAWDPTRAQMPRFERSLSVEENSFEVSHLGRALDDMSSRMRSYMDRERNFTRDASHELRTPLTVVQIAGDLLGNETLSARGERSLRRIRGAAKDMSEVIDAFMILARHPDVPVDIEEMRVQDIVYEEVGAVQEMLADKPVKLEVHADADPFIEAPPRVLGTVLAHLLRNACRFTDEGRVDVTIGRDRVDIRDTGKGMDEATLGQVFQPFYRADVGDFTAKGMGLSVAQRLAERFGWKVELSSRVGEGTQATLKFRD